MTGISGSQAADAGVGFGAIHLGKHHIKKQQIDLVAMVFEFTNGGFAIVGSDDRVAETFESLAREIAQAFVVLGDEDQFRAAAHRLDILGHLLDFPGSNSQRKIHTEGSADIDLAIDVQEATMLANDAVDGGEAQAGAFADILGGEEGLEDAIEGGRVHSGSGVGDGEHGVAAGLGMLVSRKVDLIERNFSGFDDEAAAFGHGVAGIDAQVHDDLFDLGGIGADDREIRSQIGFDFNIAADDFFREG